MEFGSAVLGSHSEDHWKYGKTKHKNGSKFGPSLKINILMQIIREFDSKSIEVSHVQIGIV